jgi:hypothetical protein
VNIKSLDPVQDKQESGFNPKSRNFHQKTLIDYQNQPHFHQNHSKTNKTTQFLSKTTPRTSISNANNEFRQLRICCIVFMQLFCSNRHTLHASRFTRYEIRAKIPQFSNKTDSIFAQISIFLKKFFTPFLITSYVPRVTENGAIFRINRASISNYRGTAFFPPLSSFEFG